ncbi:MAG TPA: ATP-binding protein [Motilibacteraceae bacterium]|nr:ATP-binding protein [Motilibacteraceae bacterium]
MTTTTAATVELSFTALPAHVRTARLVAASVARRAGVDEAVLDEVRQAVGEACSRAVGLHRRHCPDEPIRVDLVDGPDAFVVRVADRVPAPADDEEPGDLLTALDGPDSLADSLLVDTEDLPSTVGLAVIAGLVEDVEVDNGAAGTTVTMRWPSGATARVPGQVGPLATT